MFERKGQAHISFEGKTLDLPVFEGTEGEKAVDITALRKESGFITLDRAMSTPAPAPVPSPSSMGKRASSAIEVRHRGSRGELYLSRGRLSPHPFQAPHDQGIKGILRADEQLLDAARGHAEFFKNFPESAHPWPYCPAWLSLSPPSTRRWP
jgi:citrate synthase